MRTGPGSRWLLLVLFAFGNAGCGSPTVHPTADQESGLTSGAEEEPVPVELRFRRDQEVVLILNQEGEVRQQGELLGTVVLEDSSVRLLDPTGELVATLPDSGPVTGASGRELPFVILANGNLRTEGSTTNIEILADGTVEHPGVEGPLYVSIEGLNEQNRRTAMLLLMFQSGFLSDRFLGYVLEAKARQGREGIQQLADALVMGQVVLTDSLPPTPPPGFCDEAAWPVDADPRWAELGFSPTATRHSYSVLVNETGVMIEAVADLDCDEELGTYRLELVRTEDGLAPVGELTSDSPLE